MIIRLLPVLLVILSSIGWADTIQVPDDYPTIQQAIDQAANGDTVLVAAGTYAEAINFKGKQITVKSVDGPEVTVIDGMQLTTVVSFKLGETLDAVLEGFTVTNGRAQRGGGIMVQDSSATLTNNIITANSVANELPTGGLGAGLYCSNASLVMTGNTVSLNGADDPYPYEGEGSGIYALETDMNLTSNSFTENSCTGDGCILAFDSWLWLEGNTFSQNTAGEGAAVRCEDSTLTMTENTVTGCTSYGAGTISCYSGDAMLVGNTITDTVISSGYGGGIEVTGGLHFIEDNIIRNNWGATRGGGIYSSSSSNSTIINNVIENNEASDGGGIYLLHVIEVRDNTISGNSATFYGGGVLMNIWNDAAAKTLVFANNLVQGNSAGYRGGGIYCADYEDYRPNISIEENEFLENTSFYGGGVALFNDIHPMVKNNTFRLNTADYGAGLYCNNSYHGGTTDERITNNLFHGNEAAVRGGGLAMLGSRPLVTNNLFHKNRAYEGAGAFIRGAEATFTNNTFYDNNAFSGGGGLYCEVGATPFFYNCIFWNNAGHNGPEIHWQSGVESTVSFCDVKWGFDGEGNINADPLFVDPENGDFRLTFDSPCTDAGTSTAEGIEAIDFEEDPRVVDSNGDGVAEVDMGRDEFLTLRADNFTLSESAGGVINFDLDAGPGNGHRTYLVLGSVTGTAPGTPLPGGLVTLPLNLDYFTDFILLLLNTSVFENFLSNLDSQGTGWARIDAGDAIPPGAAGTIIHFTFTMNAPFDFAGNTLTAVIVP